MLKCLSVRPPWSGLIMYGGKTHENREWPCRVRGQIAIHASSKPGPGDLVDALDLYKSISGKEMSSEVERVWWGHIICAPGAILGVVDIVGCVTESDSPWFFGKYGFELANPRPLRRPIPCRGHLGFWDVPEDIEQRIVSELGEL